MTNSGRNKYTKIIELNLCLNILQFPHSIHLSGSMKMERKGPWTKVTAFRFHLPILSKGKSDFFFLERKDDEI